MKKIGLLIILYSFFSCRQHTKKDCSCKLKEIPTYKADTSFVQKEQTPYDAELEGKLSALVNKAIDGEISLKVHSSLKEVRLDKVVEVVSNEIPEKSDVLLYFRLKKLIYCEYYERLCQDTSISNSELNRVANIKLEEIDKAIESFFPRKTGHSNSPLGRKTNYGFNVIPENKKLIEYIENKTRLRFSKTDYMYLVKIQYDGEYLPVGERSTLFRFTGGKIEVLVNDNKCCSFEDMVIPGSLNSGNPRQKLLDSVTKDLQNALSTETEKIGKKIIGCLE